MPTLLAMLAWPPTGIEEGKSLVPPSRASRSAARVHLGGDAARPARSRRLIGDERLTFRGPGPGILYDLAADAGETRDLRVQRSARGKEMETRLLRRHGILLESAVRAGTMHLSEAEKERIRALGYGGAGDEH
jgi:hypothetical protein